MNADQMTTKLCNKVAFFHIPCSQTFSQAKSGKALGTVIINLQRTFFSMSGVCSIFNETYVFCTFC